LKELSDGETLIAVGTALWSSRGKKHDVQTQFLSREHAEGTGDNTM